MISIAIKEISVGGFNDEQLPSKDVIQKMVKEYEDAGTVQKLSEEVYRLQQENDDVKAEYLEIKEQVSGFMEDLNIFLETLIALDPAEEVFAEKLKTIQNKAAVANRLLTFIGKLV